MRAKKAKRLRQIAMGQTIGKPWCAYDWIKRPPVMMLNPECGRSVYQRMK